MEEVSDCDSEETIVEASLPDSGGEDEELRLDRMLFIQRNAFQLYHTMSDFTSGKEATFGGSSSPVIQMIPKTKCFRIHLENCQQQVRSLVCDEVTESEQSQSLLRPDVTCLADVSNGENINSAVTHVYVDHNYSQVEDNATDMHLELLQLEKEKLQLEIVNAKLWNKVLVLQKDILDIQKQNLQTSSTASTVPSPKIALPPNTSEVPYVLPKITKGFHTHQPSGKRRSAISKIRRCWCSTGVYKVKNHTTLGYSPTDLFGSSSFQSITPSSERSQAKDKTMLDIDFINDVPAETTEQIISEEEDSPEINLLTGAVITPGMSTKKRGVSLSKDMSETDCTVQNVPSVLSRQASSLGPGDSSMVETLISNTLPPEAEMAEQQMQGSLTQSIISSQEENLVAQGNVNEKTNSHSRDSELTLTDLLRPLSNESMTNTFTPMNMSPLMDSEIALNDGSITVEPLAERKDALPVDLLAALNKMPLMVSVTPVIQALSSANGKSAIDAGIQDNLGLRTGTVTLHDNDTHDDDDDLTQITHCELDSQPSRKTDQPEQTSIEFSNKSEAEVNTSKCETIDKLAKEPILHTTDTDLTTSSQQDNVAGSITLRKSSRKRALTDFTCSCCEFSASRIQNFDFNDGSAGKKRKTMSPVHEDLSKPQSSGTTYKNNLTSNGQQAACNEVSHSNNRPNPKTSVNIVVQPLNHQRQSRQILNCVRGCTNTRNRETVLLRNAKIKKERENIANVEYENPRRALKHGMMSVMNACQSSRAQKENGEHHHVQYQDRNLRNEAEPDGEHMQTRSASSHSIIINCRKIMNKRNVYGETKLHEAALKGDVDLLRALIQAGANVNLVDYAGWTALHEASVAGFHEAVGLLLSAEAHVDCKGLNGVTPLQDAVKGGHFEVVRLLLQHGADPFEKNELGECALQETMEIQMKRLIRSRVQGRAVAAKVGANSNISNSNSFKNSMDSKKLEESRNSKMAAMSDRTLTVKRKTENTHQVESHMESNKNTQNTVATSNIIENQVTSVDVIQLQRSVTTRHMLKLQSQLSSHPEQQITQCNSLNNKSQAAGRDEIQNVATSVAMKEIMTKPISCTSDSVVVPDGTTEAEIALRRSTRIRNSMCGLSDQTEKTSTESKQPSAENLQQNILTLKPCIAVRKNTTKATLNWKEKIKMEKRTSQESRNSKMAAMSDRALTLKRKTENTHQAESHMEFNKNTQNTVATSNIIENQVTSVDVIQPQRSVTTRHMVKLQSQLSSHPEQQITQCNSLNNKSQAAGRDEIQNVVSSVALKEVMTEPISCTSVSVIVPDGTTEAEIALRRSARIRNSVCQLSDQMEKTTEYKQPSAENLQQNILTLKPCLAGSENTIKATLSCKEKIKMEEGTSQESRNSKMAAMNDRILILKRKTENTHQAESHMESNKNTQNTVATSNIIENQATSVDVRQPQRSVTTRHMLKLQSQLSSHSEQQITQCNSLNNKSQAAGRDEIQNVASSVDVKGTKTSEPINFTSDSVVVPDGTTEAEIALRRSKRIRNSMSGLTSKTEETSTGSKQPSAENFQQNILTLKPCVALSKSTTKATMNYQEKIRMEKGTSHESRNSKTAAMNDRTLTLKRKTENTHQAKSHMESNKKTQNTVATCIAMENQATSVHMRQPQRNVTTRHMLKIQSQLSSHSEQQIIQCNSLNNKSQAAGRDEIQNVTSSVAMRETEPKPISCTSGSLVLPNGPTDAQIALRRSTRIRNSMCRLSDQTEKISTDSKQPSAENLQQNILTVKPCMAVRKNTTKATLNYQERIGMEEETSQESRNSKIAEMSDRTLTLKRKTENTHQAESDVESKKKIQNTVATYIVMENQMKSVDVRLPQRSVTPHHILKLQSQLSSHSGQQIIQCNSLNSKSQAAGRDENQTVASSVTMKEIKTKPISCTSGFVVVPDGTSEAEIALRQSIRIRNSMCGLSDQTEKTSTESKQPSAENLQQNILKPCMAGSENRMIAPLNYQESFKVLTANRLNSPNMETNSADKLCTVNMLQSVSNKSNTNNTTNNKLGTIEMLDASNSNVQPAQLKETSNHSQHSSPKPQTKDDVMNIKTICENNVILVPKTFVQGHTENNIDDHSIDHAISLETGKYNFHNDVDSTDYSDSARHLSSMEYSRTTESNTMGESRKHEPTKNKVSEENCECSVEASVILKQRCSDSMISEYESAEKPFVSMISECVSSQQESNCSTASDYERLDNGITEYKLSSNVVPTGDVSKAVIFEPVTLREKPKGVMSVTDQSISSASTCETVSIYEFSPAATNSHPGPQTYLNESNANTTGLRINKLHVACPLSMAINMEINKEANVNEARDNFARNKCKGSMQDLIKNGSAPVTQTEGNDDQRNKLQVTKRMHSIQSTNMKTEDKTAKRSDCPMPDIFTPTSESHIPKLSALNKKNGKGETRLHLAAMKGDLTSVRSLISAGIDINSKDNAGWTALHEACSRGFINIIQELLKAGADVNSRGMHGVLPLHDAVSGSHYEAVKLLLQYGADPKQKSVAGRSAFDELADDKIKDLLETHCDGEVTVHEQSQPIIDQQNVEYREEEKLTESIAGDPTAPHDLTKQMPQDGLVGSSVRTSSGPSNDNCASCDDKQIPPPLHNAKDLESPPNYILQHESITMTLNEIEMKEERMMKCKLKEHENAAQFELELSQVQKVLNEVLTKHKAEKEDLVKKIRISPGSFKQGTLQKQLTALVSRQRRFLNLLRKRKALDQKLRNYKLKQQVQQNNTVNPTKSLACTIESSIRTVTSSKEGQVWNQSEELSANSAIETSKETYIPCPSSNPECIQKQICLNQGDTGIAANQNTNQRDILQENTAGCRNERSDSACLLNGTSSNSNITAIGISKSVSNKQNSNTLPLHSLDASHVQMETLNTKQTDYTNLTACSTSGQNCLLNTIRSTNNIEKNFENNTNYTLLNTEKSSANHKEVVNTNPIQICHNSQNINFLSVVTQPVITFPQKNSGQTCTIQPITLQSKSLLPSTSRWVGNYQQSLHSNTAKLSGICQPVGMLNAVHTNQCTMPVKTTQVTQNIQNDNLVSVSTLSGKQNDSESLPEDKGSGHRKLLHLIDLISDGLIQPGEDVLEVKLQGSCHKAELLASGLIKSKDGAIHRNPVQWIKALLGDQIPVSKKFAWSKVTYKKKELSEYSSMTKSSSKLPEMHPISQSTTLTDKTSSMPPQCRTFRDPSPKIQKEKPSSNFMQFHEILLIRNEEFLPCHIMDQYWKFYTECDEWNF